MTTTLADFLRMVSSLNRDGEDDNPIMSCYWGNKFHPSAGVGKYGELIEGAYSNDGEKMYPFYEGVEWISGMTIPFDDCFIRRPDLTEPQLRGAFSLNPDRLDDWELVGNGDEVNRIERDSNPIKLLLIKADLSGDAIIPLKEAYLTSMSYREEYGKNRWNAYLYQAKGSRTYRNFINQTQISGSSRSLKGLWETWTKSATSEQYFMFHYNPSDKQEGNIYSYNYSKGINNRGWFGLGDLLG